MSSIFDCEFCHWVSLTKNATYTKQTEFYDGVEGLENIQMCWRCGDAAKFEQERIIKLLEEDYKGQNGIIWQQAFLDDLIALIKGEK